MNIGKKIWAIAEGYIPEWSTGPAPDMTSHEAACILNAGDEKAHVRLTIYYTDKPPVGPYHLEVDAKRSLHIRFNELKDPEQIAPGATYSSVFISDVPVVIQHTRLDSRQAANAVLTTIAYSE
ncbi:MAG TPA: sensory rhodopsin transducer [Puia sp.]|nr:sensory rhodopsin transducer [Puia sp.]